MDINVVRVEVKHSAQYGDKKILHVDDGTKWNVAEKKPFYKAVVGPGIYNVDVAEFNGKPYIKYLNFKGALSGSKAPTSAVSAAPATPIADNVKMRIEADKRRQDDIRLEFYCGLAKDVFIANKKKDEDISLDKIQEAGYKMFKQHLVMLDMAQAQAEETVSPKIAPTAQRAMEELAKAESSKPDDDDEVPF